MWTAKTYQETVLHNYENCPGKQAQETYLLELYEGKINIDDMAVVLRFNGQNYSFTVHDTAVFPFVQIASYCPPICSVSKRSHSHSLDHGLETEFLPCLPVKAFMIGLVGLSGD